jgi:penicillin amidase
MHFIKKALKVLVILLLLLAIGLFYFYQTSKPTYEGKIVLNSINEEVTTYFDKSGVPHIYANNKHDAYVAFGYLHAQERLWQMELVRRIASGRLSEIFGKDALENDKFFIGLGIPEAAKRDIARLDKNAPAYKLTMAYLEGVNRFIATGNTPIEYQILGIDKKPFTINDVYNVFGYMSFSFAMAHKTDPLMSALSSKLGAEYMKELPINTVAGSTLIKSYHQTNENLTKITKHLNDIWGDNSKIPAFIGSNSWVVNSKKTKNGKVIFNNDPHIMYTQPATWYMSHIKTPNYELYGFNLALTPFSLLGHNHDYAYGLTMFENDDVDFFEETINPNNTNQYKTENGWENFKTKTYTIKVKDAKDLILKVRRTRNGVIMNDLMPAKVLQVKSPKIPSKNPVAMRWIYTELPNDMMQASYTMAHSNSLADFKKGAAYFNAPGLNVMYGDAKGNIAWFASAKLYSYTTDVNRKSILDGVKNHDVIYHTFDKNPQAINPANNYVYSANNQPNDTINGKLYPGYYLPENRGKRIVDLLEAKDDWQVTDFKAMINDVTSAVDGDLNKIILNNIDKNNLSDLEHQAYTLLNKWDASYTLNSVASTIFTKIKYNYLEETFKDEMGAENFELFLSTHVYKRAIAYQLKKEETNIWWDNIGTKNIKETKSMILNIAFHKAIASLEKQLGSDISTWQWKRVHSLEHQHPFGQVPALKKYFNVGPYPVQGTNEVLNNSIFHLNGTGKYNALAGPSTRRIIDFADVEHGLTILPTGQSGNVFSKHYKDMALKYNVGEFVPMLLNKDEIIKESTKLVFTKE